MGNTISTPRIEFETTAWPLDARPHLVVERRGWTLYYGASFAEADMAKRYVERVEPASKRVGIERGEASWVGQAVEICNPSSACLQQEKVAHPRNFAWHADSFVIDRPTGKPGKSLGLLSYDELVRNSEAREERAQANFERQQAQERAWEIANGLRTT